MGKRSSGRRIAEAGLGSLPLGLALAAAGCSNGLEPTATEVRPSFILITLDDLDCRTFDAMPRARVLLKDAGLNFTTMIATRPLSCPSRASMLTGLYAHNHGVLSNLPPLGGFELFRDLGHERSNIATWLYAAGYHTVLVGKYLNAYPGEASETYVPPGWSDWFAPLLDTPAPEGADYLVNDNGRIVAYGGSEADYMTDVLTRRTTDTIRRQAANGQPFFVYLNPGAPHVPAVPAPRHADTYPDVIAPRTPAFDEGDISDKPEWLQVAPRFTDKDLARIDRLHRARLQSLLSIDDMLEGILRTLAETGLDRSTYVIFTSDNGYFEGQHRLREGKNAAYEESIRVPFVVRGPGVPHKRECDLLVGNIDIAPTLADLAGVPIPDKVDGRSLRPLLGQHPWPASLWRQEILVEAIAGGAPFPLPAYEALRTARYTYVEYDTDERELYDLTADPDQLENRASRAQPQLLRTLADRLSVLRWCDGSGCR